MGKDNTCKAVPNHGLPNQVRTACSICGSIWTDDIKGSCPSCHRRIKQRNFTQNVSK